MPVLLDWEALMMKARAAKSTSMYAVHPGVAMMQKWVSELNEKTDRSLEEWIALVKREGPKDEKRKREWLKTKHKLGTNSAWWIAERAEGKEGLDDMPEGYLKAAVQYVEEQYAEGKTASDLPTRTSLNIVPERFPPIPIVPRSTEITFLRKSSLLRILESTWASHWRHTGANFRNT
jgi:hypothetical protein